MFHPSRTYCSMCYVCNEWRKPLRSDESSFLWRTRLQSKGVLKALKSSSGDSPGHSKPLKPPCTLGSETWSHSLSSF